jgi:hypothetical protein
MRFAWGKGMATKAKQNGAQLEALRILLRAMESCAIDDRCHIIGPAVQRILRGAMFGVLNVVRDAPIKAHNL